MTLTIILAVFTKQTLIFSKMVDCIHTKMLEISVKYRIALKTNIYSLDVLLGFLEIRDRLQ